MAERSNRGVLIIYTGGTIGSAPSDPGDSESPQVVVSWEKLKEATPELKKLEDAGCHVDCHSFKDPLDSCNVGPEEWRQMAQVIFDRYDEFEGFVILHGTDTMVYSASALSFMLRDLGKPVVLTGAQRSALVDTRNDATQNFITAILIANPAFSGIPVVPEVTIFFGGKLLRGNRTIKNDTSGYTAYESPNLEPLGLVGDQFVLNERLIRPLPAPERRFSIRTRLDTHVMPLFIYPGIPTELVEKQLSVEGLRAVVVQSFGSGNIPTRSDFLEAFRKARRENEIILANVSQCRRGPVELGIYETSAELLEAGFITAGDLTVEAAQCKLMSLLGDPDTTVEEVEKQYEICMAGEQNASQYLTSFSKKQEKVERKEGAEQPGRFRLPGKALEGQWNPQRIDRALLRLRKGKVGLPKEDPVEFRVFINVDPDQPLRDDHPNLAGKFRKWPSEKAGLVVFDVTKATRAIARPGERVSFTFTVETEGGSLSWEEAEVALFIRETGV